MSKRIDRRHFLQALAGATVLGLGGKLLLEQPKRWTCRRLGPSMAAGHKVRDGRFALDGQVKQSKTRVVIVGGGIAGLSAAWWLKRKGIDDFVLLELEKQVGGNSSSGTNPVSAYPWGAHYVPLANSESQYVRLLFAELGIITGTAADGEPVYNELYLCHDPQERLLKDGIFQEGLVPARGLQDSDKQELARFFAMMKEFRQARGSDGKPAFAIPIELSSADARFRDLDLISMGQWLQDNGFKSKPLLWYVNYCCRDDYGSLASHVSAWAGIHYLAGRRGHAANAEQNSVVTWAEGNGFLVKELSRIARTQIRNGQAVVRVEEEKGVCTTVSVDTQTGQGHRYVSDAVVFACPRFMAGHVVSGLAADHELVYTPWLVANVTVERVPEGRGVGLAWDNVMYNSDSLGYVTATHQKISTRSGATVLTYYRPESGVEPSVGRQKLLEASDRQLAEDIIADLKNMHPGIEDDIVSIDLWPWGHGMIRPSVGYLWGRHRQKMLEPHGNVFFAHSDMSGISNFEEAQYRGVLAAQGILLRLSG